MKRFQALRPLSEAALPAARSHVRLAVEPALLALCVISVGAALLRFYKLGAWSFWIDEMLSVVGTPDGFNSSWLRESLALSLIQSVTHAYGITEWTARLVPAVVGAVSVPILYFPVRQLFDTPTALVACLLLALSPWHVYWSQNARFYGLLLLFYTLALLFFYLALEEDRPGYALLSLLFFALALRERPLALFLVPVAASYLLLLVVLHFEKPLGLRGRTLAVLVIPVVAGVLVFLVPFLRHLPAWLAGFGWVNNTPFRIIAGTAYYLRLPVMGVAAVAAAYLLSQKSRAGLLLAVSALLPLASITALSPFLYTANRYLFITLTSWLMLAAVGVVRLMMRAEPGAWVLALALPLILVMDLVGQNLLYFTHQNGNRDDWRAAFAFVEQHFQPSDRVLASSRELTEHYLSRRPLPLQRLALDELGGGRVWIIEDTTLSKRRPDVAAWMECHARLVASFDTLVEARPFRMRVYLYDPAFPSPTPGAGDGSTFPNCAGGRAVRTRTDP